MDPLAIFMQIVAGIGVLCALVSTGAVVLRNAKGDG